MTTARPETMDSSTDQLTLAAEVELQERGSTSAHEDAKVPLIDHGSQRCGKDQWALFTRVIAPLLLFTAAVVALLVWGTTSRSRPTVAPSMTANAANRDKSFVYISENMNCMAGSSEGSAINSHCTKTSVKFRFDVLGRVEGYDQNKYLAGIRVLEATSVNNNTGKTEARFVDESYAKGEDDKQQVGNNLQYRVTYDDVGTPLELTGQGNRTVDSQEALLSPSPLELSPTDPDVIVATDEVVRTFVTAAMSPELKQELYSSSNSQSATTQLLSVEGDRLNSGETMETGLNEYEYFRTSRTATLENSTVVLHREYKAVNTTTLSGDISMDQNATIDHKVDPDSGIIRNATMKVSLSTEQQHVASGNSNSSGILNNITSKISQDTALSSVHEFSTNHRSIVVDNIGRCTFNIPLAPAHGDAERDFRENDAEPQEEPSDPVDVKRRPGDNTNDANSTLDPSTMTHINDETPIEDANMGALDGNVTEDNNWLADAQDMRVQVTKPAGNDFESLLSQSMDDLVLDPFANHVQLLCRPRSPSNNGQGGFRFSRVAGGVRGTINLVDTVILGQRVTLPLSVTARFGGGLGKLATIGQYSNKELLSEKDNNRVNLLAQDYFNTIACTDGVTAIDDVLADDGCSALKGSDAWSAFTKMKKACEEGQGKIKKCSKGKTMKCISGYRCFLKQVLFRKAAACHGTKFSDEPSSWGQSKTVKLNKFFQKYSRPTIANLDELVRLEYIDSYRLEQHKDMTFSCTDEFKKKMEGDIKETTETARPGKSAHGKRLAIDIAYDDKQWMQDNAKYFSFKQTYTSDNHWVYDKTLTTGKHTVQVDAVSKVGRYGAQLLKARREVSLTGSSATLLSTNAQAGNNLLGKGIPYRVKRTNMCKGCCLYVAGLLKVCFGLNFYFGRGLPIDMSALPPKVTVAPRIAAGVEATAYASVWIARAGLYVRGQLVDFRLPFSVGVEKFELWPKLLITACARVNAHVNALNIQAGLYYQWRKLRCRCRRWSCGCRWRWSSYRYFGPQIRWSLYQRTLRLVNACLRVK